MIVSFITCKLAAIHQTKLLVVLISVTTIMKCSEYISYILVFPADSNAYFMGVPIRCFGLVAALENNNISCASFKDY